MLIVCQVAPAPSHTYITEHLRHLSRLPPVYGREPMVGETPALSMPERLLFKVRRRMLREGPLVQTQRGYIRALRRLKPHVVLAEFGDIGVRVMDACAHLSIPLVVHFHGRDASRYSVLETLRDSYRRMFAQAAGVVAVSRDMVRTLENLGCPSSKLHLIPCGVDPTRFQGAAPAQAPPVFVAVGRLIEKKGPLTTIAAFKQVVAEVPDARLRVIGDGVLRESCEALIRQLRLEKSVTLLGIRSNEEVASEMRAARAFVQHSLRAATGDTEGTPVSVMEAGACGLPIVSTRHAGIPDVVIDGRTGFLVEEADVGGMARGMITLARQPELAARMGEAGRHHVVLNFSADQAIGKLAAVVEAAARTGRTAA